METMMNRTVAAAFACAALAMPVVASAAPDDAMGNGMMKHDSAMSATMLCRKAQPGEKPTAMMAGDAKTGIVCKTMQPDMMMKKTSGPKIAPSMSAEQVDAAWRAYLQQITQVPGGTGGG
jgi:hypothetical protein